MDLKTRLVSPAYTRTPSSTRNSLFGALAIGASTLLSPTKAFAQPQVASTVHNCPTRLTGPHSSREWQENGLTFYMCGGTTSFPEEARRNYFFNAFEAFVHASTDSTDIAAHQSALPELNFNLRTSARRALDLSQLALPLSIGRQVTPEQVATRHRENEIIKAANMQAVNGFLNRLVPSTTVPNSAESRVVAQRVLEVRSLAIQLLRVTDSNLSSLLSVYHDSLLPIADSLQICGGTRTARVNGEAFTILNTFLCARAGTLSYRDFLRVATDPNLESALPGQHWPSTLVNGRGDRINANFASTLGLVVDGRTANMDSLVRSINEQFYLLHLYIRLVNGIDEIVVRQGGVSVVSGIRLTNVVATTPEAIARVIEPENMPSVGTPNNPNPHPTPISPIVRPNPGQLNVVVNPPIDTAQLARTRALEAYQSRVRMWRIIGISAAGAGAVTLGTGWGLSAANASEAQNVPNTPENRARHAEIEQIRAGVYHTQADVDHANARLQAIHTGFLASVTPYQDTASTLQVVSYVGLGVMIAGGAVAALAPVLAGSPPAQPASPSLVPTGGRQGPHPATTPGRRTENGDGQDSQFGLAPLVTNTTVGVTATGTF